MTKKEYTYGSGQTVRLQFSGNESLMKASYLLLDGYKDKSHGQCITI